MFTHLALLFGFSWFTLVSCRHNFTVDDHDPSIVYKGTWVLSANDSLDVGAFHMLTQDPTATATFTFTGVAVYFMSPLWPYTVNTAVSLDGGSPILLDLVDPSRPNVGQGPETVQSQVIWGAAGLPNTQHTLIISVGAGQPYAVVDALIYTVLDPEDSTSLSSPTSSAPDPSSTSSSTKTQDPSSTSPANDAATSNPSGTSSSSSHVVAIALGTVLGVCALLIVAIGVWFCNRRRKRPTSEAWTVAGTPYPGSPQIGQTMTDAPSSTFSGGSSYAYTDANAYQPYDSGWSSPHYATPGPIPGAMAPATAAALAQHPYATASPVVQEDKGDTWQGTTAQISQRYMRSPNRYQPNTLSTITETSTPPLGGGTPLAHSPSSYATDIGSDAGVQATGSHPHQNLGAPFSAPTTTKPGYPHPPAYTPP
ncbi:hypothetical protein LshimejAT787_0112810 [Lyophyllum shimeji]|uniref:Transmembrane protein n=1 Tax=Lyophyllum shimeji TaxID=47721 RepID=A0A9P3PFC6_LYOSH|nr:hypothetical protein LshimejAT787_0112810 [Lyophyllum shimeji]